MKNFKPLAVIAVCTLLLCISAYCARAECSIELLRAAKLPTLPVTDEDNHVMSHYDYLDILVKVFINKGCSATTFGRFAPDYIDLVETWSVPRRHPVVPALQCLGSNSDWISTFIDCRGHYYLFNGNHTLSRNETAFVLARLVRELAVVYSVDFSGLSTGGCGCGAPSAVDNYWTRDSVTGVSRSCPGALCCVYEEDLGRTAWSLDTWQHVCGLLPGYPSETCAGGTAVTVKEFKESINRIADYINLNSIIIED